MWPVFHFLLNECHQISHFEVDYQRKAVIAGQKLVNLALFVAIGVRWQVVGPLSMCFADLQT